MWYTLRHRPSGGIIKVLVESWHEENRLLRFIPMWDWEVIDTE